MHESLDATLLQIHAQGGETPLCKKADELQAVAACFAKESVPVLRLRAQAQPESRD
jgi:hypothetical protein